MTMILTVFGIIVAACLAPIVAGAIVVYWKQLLLSAGILLILFAGLVTWSVYQSRRAMKPTMPLIPKSIDGFMIQLMRNESAWLTTLPWLSTTGAIRETR